MGNIENGSKIAILYYHDALLARHNMASLDRQHYKINPEEFDCQLDDRLHGYPTHHRANHVMIKTRKEWKHKVVPYETTYSSTCLMSKEDEVKLWYQKLGHLNLKGISLGVDVDEHAGTSSEQTEASENVEDIESNIEPTRNKSDASADI
ncbi:hypothetical protein KIW84_040527 [Lathyrus oleraceus]|uniref:GAG-pre-integrase domain-containing protein n=1 Tax=Pisum sativum TaxID=3888 RepID=A0A9D5AK81_PEA|nr:hypothetical protein KIW84_040527 [Pisum sativum]